MSFEGRLYLGMGAAGPLFAPREVAALLLGPPRSGKSSCLMMPNVAGHGGAVVSASTKPDVMEATVAARRELGRCWLFDPSATLAAPGGVERVHWSPLHGSRHWDGATSVARALVGARPGGLAQGEGAHWAERAEALLAPLLHAASLAGLSMSEACSWVERHDLAPAEAILERWGAEIGSGVLEGIARTAPKEQASIFSTAAGVLAAYRSASAREPGPMPIFDAESFVEGSDTLYICAPSHRQALLAPLVVGAVSDVRNAAYARATRLAQAGPTQGARSVLVALDEAANIAPLADLPSVASEGGGQGLLSLVSLQDLSQARRRWGAEADAFFTLFGAKVMLPGVADRATLELVSLLAGEEELPVRSRSRGRTGRQRSSSASLSLQRRQRLAPDAVARGRRGTALVLQGGEGASRVALTPWGVAPREIGREREPQSRELSR